MVPKDLFGEGPTWCEIVILLSRWVYWSLLLGGGWSSEAVSSFPFYILLPSYFFGYWFVVVLQPCPSRFSSCCPLLNLLYPSKSELFPTTPHPAMVASTTILLAPRTFALHDTFVSPHPIYTDRVNIILLPPVPVLNSSLKFRWLELHLYPRLHLFFWPGLLQRMFFQVSCFHGSITVRSTTLAFMTSWLSCHSYTT